MQVQRNIEQDKYARIISGATRVFADKGFFKATVSDVARAADVAEGTIYLYFKNKDDLLISIFETNMDMFLREIKRELAQHDDVSEKLRQFIRLHLRLVDENQEVAQVLNVELRQSEKFMKEYRGGKFLAYLELVQELIDQGKEVGIFRENLDSRIARRSLFGALDEVSLEWILSKKKRYKIDEYADQVASLFLNGLVKPLEERI
jgi:TetR/AcrR family transcriptional regulator, fatty acid metabolism regulator protein